MLDERRERFIDWLCGGPERLEGQTQADFARDVMGVDPSRLAHWKSERDFLRRWDERMRELHGAPDRLSDQLEALAQIAKGGRDIRASDQIKAIETYWKLLGKLQPKVTKVEVGPAAPVQELSDAQLRAAIGPSAADDAVPVESELVA